MTRISRSTTSVDDKGGITITTTWKVAGGTRGETSYVSRKEIEDAGYRRISDDPEDAVRAWLLYRYNAMVEAGAFHSQRVYDRVIRRLRKREFIAGYNAANERKS